MSFRCQKCSVAQPPGTRPHRVVTRWREFDGNYDRSAMRQIAEEQNWCDECLDEIAPKAESEEGGLTASLEERCAS